MRVHDTGATGRAVTADLLLATAEQAFLRAEFDVVRPILRRVQGEFGMPSVHRDAVRYCALRAALAARAGNWGEAVRQCPDLGDLDAAETGVVHALALAALRALGEEASGTGPGTAALVIVLWAYLLDEEDPGDFRAVLTERRGTPVADELWDDARRQLLSRVTALLHALDVRAGRDVLAAWETAWEAECVAPAVDPVDAGPDGLLPVERAAWHLAVQGRHLALLHAYTARHPDPGTWTADSAEHRACAKALGRALAERGSTRVRAGEWSESLADIDRAARLGHTLRAGERADVLKAANNVGRSRNGYGYSPVTRIQGLELAHALLPEERSLTAELTAELVRQGTKVLDSNPQESRNRYRRALELAPRDRDARSGLDKHLMADLDRALDGTRRGEKLRVSDVQGLLRRHPDCEPARSWLVDYYMTRAVSAASRGHTSTARSAVNKLLLYDGYTDCYGNEYVDQVLVDLLVDAARRSGAGDGRAGLERRVDLLSVALTFSGPVLDEARKELDTAVLRLAEHLEATASPSDVIALFLRDLMRTGVSARFDRTVEAAYLHRARAREEAGDLGGARHDRACAERIGAGLPDQGLLFGPAPEWQDFDDTGQEALF
ncbi:hypothetical protein [Streptomyces sp. NPDC090994]|uniref:hypothetical protein n=1 Tax=Streptomyces sp. NPDC090994 TaxID=3365969 RepID=UPI003828E3F8